MKGSYRDCSRCPVYLTVLIRGLVGRTGGSVPLKGLRSYKETANNHHTGSQESASDLSFS